MSWTQIAILAALYGVYVGAVALWEARKTESPQFLQLERQRYLQRKIGDDFRPKSEVFVKDCWTFNIWNVETEHRKPVSEWMYELRLRWWEKEKPWDLVLVRSQLPGRGLSHPDVLEQKLQALEACALAEIEKLRDAGSVV